jgi:hypothetical protein
MVAPKSDHDSITRTTNSLNNQKRYKRCMHLIMHFPMHKTQVHQGHHPASITNNVSHNVENDTTEHARL